MVKPDFPPDWRGIQHSFIPPGHAAAGVVWRTRTLCWTADNAADGFMAARGLRVLELPTRQGMVVRR